ncbi:MAG: hypothetical protein LBT51_03195 [Fusobacteriaceae bacterium]|jgi:hypothetical protein|nr:hypothetical protein [Fusobacteriaceae bacterium]
MDFFDDWAEDIYKNTFDEMYDALVDQYKSGKLNIEDLERNVKEQQQILLNSLHEGENKNTYNTAVVDAHEFVLSLIKKGSI